MVIIKQTNKNKDRYSIYKRYSFRDKETKKVKKSDKYILTLQQIDIDNQLYKYLDFTVLREEFKNLGEEIEKALHRKFNILHTTK